jgi:hypothetical protein
MVSYPARCRCQGEVPYRARRVIAACEPPIPVPRVPARVRVIRDGKRLAPPPQGGGNSTPTGPGLSLQAGDEIRVGSRASFTFSYGGNRYRIPHGRVRLSCSHVRLGAGKPGPFTRLLAVRLESGRIEVRSGGRPERALVLSPELLAFGKVRDTDFVVERDPAARSTRAVTRNRAIVVASSPKQRLRINAWVTYTAIADSSGLRLDVWPFSVSPMQRATTGADGLVPYWADGLPCSVGCTAPGSTPGWPLQPFHEQHAIRAGINELRPANFHVAVDIEAANFQPVYAIQSGYASVRYPGTGDVNVDVGDFYYWHINPTVSNGQYVVAYKTVIGQVLYGFYHVALSEGNTSNYLNPLRPGGSLRPYADTERPIIGAPRVFADGRVIVGAFDPQSFVEPGTYETPVLAPSSLAWRLYDERGRALTRLEWAMRGSQNYPLGLKPVVFAPGASNPGFQCFFTQLRCIPNWVYWLAGGLTRPLPLSSLRSGRYRLTVYAWDWAGNTSALDYWIKLPLGKAARISGAEFGPLAPKFDYP